MADSWGFHGTSRIQLPKSFSKSAPTTVISSLRNRFLERKGFGVNTTKKPVSSTYRKAFRPMQKRWNWLKANLCFETFPKGKYLNPFKSVRGKHKSHAHAHTHISLPSCRNWHVLLSNHKKRYLKNQLGTSYRGVWICFSQVSGISKPLVLKSHDS